VRPAGAALAALATAAVALAGCGGSSKDDEARAAFARRADAICRAGDVEARRLQDAVAAAQRGSDRHRVFAELARLTRRAVTISAPFVERLDALEKPGADREELQAWIAASRRHLVLVERLANAFGREDETRVATLSEQIDALAMRNDAFARDYGMEDCARAR
jgi:hypothetical protein